MKLFTLAITLAILVNVSVPMEAAAKPASPTNGMIKIAIVLSDHATVIDFAGPWEVFQDAMLKGPHGEMIMPFELYTVAPSKAPIHTTGSNRPGLTITPDYDFTDAPVPDIVVVGAQSGGPGLSAWLKKVHAEHKTIMSVCTGAFRLAETGLLDGKKATTHHWFFGNFARQFPDVKLVKQVRYVQAGPILFTAGGLTSGIDLALHIVADRFGQKVAQKTADYMEYLGMGWKTNKGISTLTTPVRHVAWSGQLAPDTAIVLHMVIRGASPTSFTADVPAWNVIGAPTSVNQDGKKVSFTFQDADRVVTFKGRVRSSADGSVINGTLIRDGKSYPLALSKSDAEVARAESSAAKQ